VPGVVVAVVVVLAGVATWWFATVHPGTHLGASSLTTTCTVRVDDGSGDVVRGGITLEAPADAEVLAVRLRDAENLVLEEARVAPETGPNAQGEFVAPGLERKWPIPDPESYTMDWSRDRPLVGARLEAGVTEVPYLHLRIVDTEQPARMSGWEVEYRVYATRWSTAYATGLEYLPVDSADECFAEE